MSSSPFSSEHPLPPPKAPLSPLFLTFPFHPPLPPSHHHHHSHSASFSGTDPVRLYNGLDLVASDSAMEEEEEELAIGTGGGLFSSWSRWTAGSGLERRGG